MASSTLSPYKNNTTQETFSLQTVSSTGTKYLVSGRSLSQPYTLEVVRKLTAPSASGNDRVELRVTRSEANATTGKLATLVGTLSISIPKDISVLDADAQAEAISILASLVNESTAMEATKVAITALIEGRDL
jgi:hypothetical protein